MTETESGISEFLLPLLYKNYLSHVLWVKQYWCTQFKDGTYSFNIGDINDHIYENNIAGVTLKHSYYADDSNICDVLDLFKSEADPCSKLQSEHPSSQTRNVTFSVHTTNTNNTNNPIDHTNANMHYVLPLPNDLYTTTLENVKVSKFNWILDICLDYFSTSNPFLNELKVRLLQENVISKDDITLKFLKLPTVEFIIILFFSIFYS